MIYLLISYLLFQIIYDHWSTVEWDAVYFAFQFGWTGAVALWYFMQTKNRIALFVSVILTCISIDELLSLFFEVAQDHATPAFRFTIFAGLIFIMFEIFTLWKKKVSS